MRSTAGMSVLRSLCEGPLPLGNVRMEPVRKLFLTNPASARSKKLPTTWSLKGCQTAVFVESTLQIPRLEGD